MKLNRIAFAVLLAAVAAAAVLTYLRMSGTLPEGWPSAGRGSEPAAVSPVKTICAFSYQHSDGTSFTGYRQWIVRADRETICAYDLEGREAWRIHTGMAGRAYMDAPGDAYLLVADIGGKTIRLLENGEVRLTLSSPDILISASLSRSGRITLVHKTPNARNAVSVYNTKGQLQFTRYIIERFVTWAAVLQDADRVGISSLDVSGVQAANDVEWTDLRGTSSGEGMHYPDTVFLWMQAAPKGLLYLADQRRLVCLDSREGQRWEAVFDDGGISALCLLGNGAVVAGDPGQESRLTFLDRDGEVVRTVPISFHPSRMVLSGRRLILSDTRTVHFFSLKGESLGEYLTGTDITRLLSLGNGRVAVISGNRVEVLSL